MIIDNENNVYIGTSSLYKEHTTTVGNVYKYNKNKKQLTKIIGTTGGIWSLTIDKIGNVYAGNNNGTIFKCSDQQTFKEIIIIPNQLLLEQSLSNLEDIDLAAVNKEDTMQPSTSEVKASMPSI